MANHNFKALLHTLVDLLKTQGMDAAGEIDALQAYAALLALKSEAEAFGVPMEAVGLVGFEIDRLLHKSHEGRMSNSAMPSADQEKLAGALICLSQLVDQLKEEGLERAGRHDALFAYGLLNRLKNHAEIYGVPLEDIGLLDFDPDSLLRVPATGS